MAGRHDSPFSEPISKSKLSPSTHSVLRCHNGVVERINPALGMVIGVWPRSQFSGARRGCLCWRVGLPS
jgi:hypothetical protein